MKFVLLSLCIFTFMFVTQSKQLTDDVPVGFSNKKINGLLEKAILGFRDIMINGDQELNFPIMEPYNAGDFKWDYASKSEKLEFNFQNMLLEGLSDFNILNSQFYPKDLKFIFSVEFQDVELHGPYKSNGHAFKQWLPIYGDGDFSINAQRLYLHVSIRLALEKSVIEVADVKVIPGSYVYRDFFHASATNLMDLPSEFTDAYLNEMLLDWYYSYYYNIGRMLSQYAKKIVEDRIGGMTMEELYEFIDYLAQKK